MINGLAQAFMSLWWGEPVYDDGWIQVSDRLPDLGAHVLVSNGKFVTIDCYSMNDHGTPVWQNGNLHDSGGSEIYINYTHWRPLPEAPK